LSAFQGTSPGSGGKGLVELFLYKWDVARYIMNDFITSIGTPPEVVVQIKTIMHSVKTYRDACGYPTDHKDMVFRAGWRLSSEEVFVLLEGILFDTMYDSQLKDALKACQAPADAVANQLSEVTARITTLAQTESTEKDAEDDTDDDDPAGDAGAARSSADGHRPSNGAPLAKRRRVGEDGVMDDDNEMVAEDPQLTAAKRLMATHCQFLPDNGGTDIKLAELIAGTAAGKYLCSEHGNQGRGYVMMVFDPGNLGESSAHPHLRKPALQADSAQRVIRVGMMARAMAHTGIPTVNEIGEDRPARSNQ
jgi:hypothetical protein